jgi:hypothetical protein
LEVFIVKTRRVYGAWIIVLALLATGCGGGEETDPNVVPASGTVTLDGKPLEGASVTFSGPGQGGVGVTDAAGKYEITHFRAGKGVRPGQYSVMITKQVMADGKPLPAGAESAVELNTKDLVPPQYNVGTTLKANVEAGGKPIDFALKSR